MLSRVTILSNAPTDTALLNLVWTPVYSSAAVAFLRPLLRLVMMIARSWLTDIPLLWNLLGFRSLLLHLAVILRLDLLGCSLPAAGLLGRRSLIFLAHDGVVVNLLAPTARAGLLWFSALFFISLLLGSSATLLGGWSRSGSVFLILLILDLRLGLGFAGTLLGSWGWGLLVFLVLDLLAFGFGSGLLLGLLFGILVLVVLVILVVLLGAFLRLLCFGLLIPYAIRFRILM
jgi:hypothetical protein